MNITFKSVLKTFNLIKEDRVAECLNILGINDLVEEEQIFVLNEIAEYVFNTNKKASSSKKTFDLNLDYKYYFVDFLTFGINLNTDDVPWWEFDAILEAIMLDDKSTISRVLSYRLYEKPPKNAKVQEEKRHRFMMEMKRKYSLPETLNPEQGLEKLWNYVEKKAGESKRMEK